MKYKPPVDYTTSDFYREARIEAEAKTTERIELEYYGLEIKDIEHDIGGWRFSCRPPRKQHMEVKNEILL